MILADSVLVDSLRKAYSAERAAALAYVGHAASLQNPATKAAVRQIELDEWAHREHVRRIMQQYEIPVSRWSELKFFLIGKVIAASCHVIGWFMPIYFAGKLESGNVCEYFVMMHRFHALGIHEHDAILHEMGLKEKEHEVFFLAQIKDSRLMPIFETLFSWGRHAALNDVNLERKYPVPESYRYCAGYSEKD